MDAAAVRHGLLAAPPLEFGKTEFRGQIISCVKSLRERPKSDSIYRDEITYLGMKLRIFALRLVLRELLQSLPALWWMMA
jgi:hypothetical protein